MILILTSKEDVASMNIREELLDLGEWKPAGIFDGNEVLAYGDMAMVEINEIHLHCEDLDLQVKEELDIEPDMIIVASRHRSQSKLRTLTVHPLGNFTSADFGGKPGTLAKTAPRKMTQAFLTLSRKASDLDFHISFEATHHGPYIDTPTFFIEIGSDETAWPEKPPARAIAETIMSIAIKPGQSLETEDDIIAIGIGGGHYMPRMSEVAMTHQISFGHMVPGYATDALDNDMLVQLMKQVPDVEGVYFHRKALSKPRLRELKAMCEELGLKVLSSKEIPLR